MPGETVIAVGNAYGYEHTVTLGIISALHRSVQVSETQQYDDLIQTDASINPGNSGGPLLNIDGQMVGINVAVRAGAQGIGFAIPVDKVLSVAAELLSARRIKNLWHGVVARWDERGEQAAVVVASLEENSPASAAGLRPGDVIRAVDHQHVAHPLDLERALLGQQAGDAVKLQVVRGGEELSLNLVLASPPRPRRLTPAEQVWEVLGLRLEPMPAQQFRQLRSRYHGGLRVLDVRPGSLAAEQGMKRGDVLVGMHIWETLSLDNVAYVLNRPDLQTLLPLKFYVLRGTKPLYGYFELPAAP
jgi:serine protease Do